MKPFIASLYQSPLLAAYADRLNYGFAGQPHSVGGPQTLDNSSEAVERTKRQLLQQLAPEAIHWVQGEQVHGCQVLPDDATDWRKTDGILVLRPHRPALVLTADCVPVLLYDPVQHVGALVHAGWRGTAQQITAHAIQSLHDQAGSDAADIIAVIGPCIRFSTFETRLETAQELAIGHALSLDELYQSGLARVSTENSNKVFVDLQGLNALQCQRLGVTQIDNSSLCTVQDHPQLFSHRRGDAGRNANWLILKS